MGVFFKYILFQKLNLLIIIRFFSMLVVTFFILYSILMENK